MDKNKGDIGSLSILRTCPGRVRFRFKPCVAGKKISGPDKSIFLEINGVEDASFNEVTNTLLIIYNEGVLSLHDLIVRIKEKASYLKILNRRRGLDMVDDGNMISKFVLGGMKNLNRNINSMTGGYTDLGSIVPSFLLLLGTVELMRKPIMPRWYDFYWWSTNMYYWQLAGHERKAILQEEMLIERMEKGIEANVIKQDRSRSLGKNRRKP